ncbi:MAG: HAMP domain-containing histidine kinase [Bdellovibrionales bacterium]|nr:HAMP domain-containing histidine kinase [Bdellovibrionales bacterium]
MGQLAFLAIGFVGWRLSLPYYSLLITISLIGITELLYHHLFIKFLRREHAVAVLLVCDTFILTGLLYFSGGPTNPFSLVYLVLVVLTAVLLGSNWAWTITALSSLCFASLFLWHHPINGLHHSDHTNGLSLHLQGMLFSFILVASLVAFFLNKILAEHQMAEARCRALADRQHRLASITALSADAAHQLNTPLGSITLIAHELERSLCNLPSPDLQAFKDDLALLKSQAMRCKEIISNLAQNSGSIIGSVPERFSVKELVHNLISELNSNGDIGVTLSMPDFYVMLQRNAFNMTLKALIKNAIEAGSNKVAIHGSLSDAGGLRIIITDNGKGMTAEELSHIKEPFFSTKDNGIGMGLGVYLADLVATQLGGRLHYRTALHKGTEVVLELPCSDLAKFSEVA